MNKRKLAFAVPIILLGAVLLYGFTDQYYFQINKSFDLFGSVFRELSANYVDEIEPGDLVEDGINGMMKNLDPYTVYMNESDTDDIDMVTTGAYTGLGITVGVRDSMITIIEVQDGFSAQRNGIRIGDRIFKVDSAVILNKSTDELRKYTRGKAGSTVDFWVLRDGIDDTLHFVLPREEIKLKNISYNGVVGDSIGYIKLDRFTRSSAEEVKTSLIALKKQGINSVILDLRDNPGGLLEAAVAICEIFVPTNSVIVSTKGRNNIGTRTYRSVVKPMESDLPLAVLIDNGSASASEIVAGAIQDLDRGIIIGQRSFGKGLVQSIFDLPYNSAIKITTAKYYTPSGRCIQKFDYYKKKNPTKNIPVQKFYTLNGRELEESNGILPDSSVADEVYPFFIQELLKSGSLFKFASNLTSKYKTLAEDYKVTSQTLDELNNFLNKNKFFFKTPIHSKIEEFREMSKKEKFSDKTIKIIDELKLSVEKEEKNLIKKHSKELSNILENEILSRFLTQKQMIYRLIPEDNYINTAIDLLSKAKYNKLLAGTKAVLKDKN
jgi:carboxyl-terminal processing protease